MESEADYDDTEKVQDSAIESVLKELGGKKSKKKKKRKRGKKRTKVPKDMVLNENGELVPAKEYILEKTYNYNS